VEELRERRAYLCRLTPDRALESFDEALDFLGDRGMLTRTPGTALPSLFEACHEEPYAPGSRGFGSWPATKYPWYFELAERPDVHELKVHNGKSILLTDENLALVDSICRAELARMEREAKWAPLLAHLTAAGPSTPTDLQTELGLKPRDLKSLRTPLERCGAIFESSCPRVGTRTPASSSATTRRIPIRAATAASPSSSPPRCAPRLSRRSARSPARGSAGVGCWTTHSSSG
jgi:hypothetical protein